MRNLAAVVDFDHMTPDVLRTFKVRWSKVKVTASVKTSYDRQIIALIYEIGVAEFNGDLDV